MREASVSRAGLTFTSALLPRVIGSGGFFVGDAPNLTPTIEDGPQDGRLSDATAAVTIRMSRSLMLDVSYLFDRLRDVRAGGVVYANNIARVRMGEQFTRSAALRAIVQYNQLTVDSGRTILQPGRNVNYDVLFSYLTSPGTAIYVGANDNFADIDPRLVTPSGLLRSPTLNNTGWQIFTKMSYLVRR